MHMQSSHAVAGMFETLLKLKQANPVLSARLVRLFEINFKGISGASSKEKHATGLSTPKGKAKLDYASPTKQ